MLHEEISARLIAAAQPSRQLTIPKTAGVYAYFLTEGASLGDIETRPDRLLYVGMTEDGLDVRNHFGKQSSGFSTFRRSLGAILKDQLDLSAMPRSQGPSKTNSLNYAFAGNGEASLSKWMEGNLLASFVSVQSSDISQLEKALITQMEPPLNLTDWKNPQRNRIKELRARCVTEASQRQ